MARWLLEQRSVPYCEDVFAPVFNTFGTWRNSLDQRAPIAIAPEGIWAGISGFLDALDERCRSGEKVYGEDAKERHRVRDAIAVFEAKLFWPAIQIYYHFMLAQREATLKYTLDGVPGWQSGLVRVLFPIWRHMFASRIFRGPFDLDAAVADVDSVFEFVEERISGKRPYLGGATPCAADIVFSSLAAPLILPSKFGAPLPSLDDLPRDYQKLVRAFRKREAGKLVAATYKAARTVPQPSFKIPSKRPGLLALILQPELIAAAARLAVRVRPSFRFFGRVVVLSWRQVTDVLQRDAEFLISPINEKRIGDVSGPFILGMDRSPDLFAQREAVYGALRRADKQGVANILREEPDKLITAASERYEQIDVVNGYARLVAVRVTASVFGVAGPTEQDLMRVIRSVFHETFLNLGDNEAIRARGIAAGKELGSWIDAEIARRKKMTTAQPDVLDGLLVAQRRLGLKPESVRWMLAGLMVGAVDTTATSVANIMAELLNRPDMLEAARRDLRDKRRMLGWCYEALRARPHNPIVLRQAAHATKIGKTRVEADDTVIAATLPAMQDAGAFPSPFKADPNRPLGRYLHFGFGLHACAGRNLNAVQIPHLVTRLLHHGAHGKAKLVSRGPFPDELIVRLRE